MYSLNIKTIMFDSLNP